MTRRRAVAWRGSEPILEAIRHPNSRPLKPIPHNLGEHRLQICDGEPLVDCYDVFEVDVSVVRQALRTVPVRFLIHRGREPATRHDSSVTVLSK